MSRLLDAKGERIPSSGGARDIQEAIEEAEDSMARMIGAAMWGNSPEDRVWRLRESVTGERQKRPQYTGLSHWLPLTAPKETP